MSVWVLRGYPFVCVMKCMDMHGGRHWENLAAVGPYFLLALHHNRELKESQITEKSKEREPLKSQRGGLLSVM